MEKYRIFTPESLKGCLICVVNPDVEPDSVTRKGNLAILKKDGAAVGYNLFGYAGGAPLEALNAALSEAGEEPLAPEGDAGRTIEAKAVAVSEHPLDPFLSIVDLDNGKSVVTSLEGIEPGDSLEYLPAGGIAPDGEASKDAKVRNVASSGMVFKKE